MVKDQVSSVVLACYKLDRVAPDFKQRIAKLKLNSNYIYPGDVMVSPLIVCLWSITDYVM